MVLCNTKLVRENPKTLLAIRKDFMRKNIFGLGLSRYTYRTGTKQIRIFFE